MKHHRWIAATIIMLGACVINLPDREIDGGGRDDTGAPDDGAKTDQPPLPPGCGNATLDPKERCDVKIPAGDQGACPTDCDDGVACTIDRLENGGTCYALCTNIPIVQCVSDDGCCPGGCDSAKDKDCSATCGNGQLDAKETCDTKIAKGKPNACPTDCNDENVCTKDSLINGGSCSAQCTHTPISACVSGDGCCPSGCDNTSDKDCSVSCGNGVKEGSEKCDTGIAKGLRGACPTTCNDGNPCTTDRLLNTGTCDAQCSSSAIRQCKRGDGCCPSGCNANTDADCPPTCGNGIKERGEACDGNCPTSCAAKTCQSWSISGLAAKCTAFCKWANKAAGSSCSGGRCLGNGVCCKGCRDGTICRTGTVVSKCGAGGATCSTCSAGPCTIAHCTNRACTVSNAIDGTACSGGRCYSGVCCKGCWDGSTCQSGKTVTLCGVGGVNCRACSTNNPCKTAKCSAGACNTPNLIDGVSCTGGKCYAGSCCTGCWNGSACRPGITDNACGRFGNACLQCGSNECCSTGQSCWPAAKGNCLL